MRRIWVTACAVVCMGIAGSVTALGEDTLPEGALTIESVADAADFAADYTTDIVIGENTVLTIGREDQSDPTVPVTRPVDTSITVNSGGLEVTAFPGYEASLTLSGTGSITLNGEDAWFSLQGGQNGAASVTLGAEGVFTVNDGVLEVIASQSMNSGTPGGTADFTTGRFVVNGGNAYFTMMNAPGNGPNGVPSLTILENTTAGDTYGIEVNGGELYIDGFTDVDLTGGGTANHKGISVTGGELVLDGYSAPEIEATIVHYDEGENWYFAEGQEINVSGGTFRALGGVYMYDGGYDYGDGAGMALVMTGGKTVLGAYTDGFDFEPLSAGGSLAVGNTYFQGGVLEAYSYSELSVHGLTQEHADDLGYNEGDLVFGKDFTIRTMLGVESEDGYNDIAALYIGHEGSDTRAIVNGTIDMSGGFVSIYANGTNQDVILNGRIVAGGGEFLYYDDDDSAYYDGYYGFSLYTGSDYVSATLGKDFSVSLTPERQYLLNMYKNGDLDPAADQSDIRTIVYSGGPDFTLDGLPDVLTQKTGLGTYTFGLLDDDEYGVLDIENEVLFSDYAGDLNTYKKNMAGVIGSQYQDSGLIANSLNAVYSELNRLNPTFGPDEMGAIRYTPVTAADGSAAGQYNYALLNALSNGIGSFSYTVGGVDENGDPNRIYSAIDDGVLDSYVGNNQNGMVMAAFDNVLDNIASVNGRIGQINNQWAAARSVSSSDSMASAIMNCSAMNRVWLAGLGQWVDTDARSGMNGYKYDSYGFMLGYDRAFGDNFVAGLSFGYTKGDYENKAMQSNDSDIDNYSVNGYLTYNHASGFFGTLMGGYVFSDNDIAETNAAGRWKEDFDSDTWYVGAKLGYDWRPTTNFHIIPSVGLSYVDARSEGHDRVNETIAASTVNYGRAKYNTAILPVDLTVGYDIPVGACGTSYVNVAVNGGYSYSFDADGADGSMFLHGLNGATGYSLKTRQNGHNTWNAGAGLRYVTERFEVGAKYDYYSRSSSDTHRVTAQFGIKF